MAKGLLKKYCTLLANVLDADHQNSCFAWHSGYTYFWWVSEIFWSIFNPQWSLVQCKSIFKDTISIQWTHHIHVVYIDSDFQCLLIRVYFIHFDKPFLNSLNWRLAVGREIILSVNYPPEVRSMKYCFLGVFRKEYFPACTEPLNKRLSSASVQGCINVFWPMKKSTKQPWLSTN